MVMVELALANEKELKHGKVNGSDMPAVASLLHPARPDPVPVSSYLLRQVIYETKWVMGVKAAEIHHHHRQQQRCGSAGQSDQVAA